MQRTPRQHLWVALSNLYLDTDVTLFYDQILRVIEEHGFADAEVERALLDEVEPVLHTNLTQVAGEWAGFDDEWVIEHITAHMRGAGARSARPWSLRNDARRHLKAIQHKRSLGSG